VIAAQEMRQLNTSAPDDIKVKKKLGEYRSTKELRGHLLYIPINITNLLLSGYDTMNCVSSFMFGIARHQYVKRWQKNIYKFRLLTFTK